MFFGFSTVVPSGQYSRDPKSICIFSKQARKTQISFCFWPWNTDRITRVWKEYYETFNILTFCRKRASFLTLFIEKTKQNTIHSSNFKEERENVRQMCSSSATKDGRPVDHHWDHPNHITTTLTFSCEGIGVESPKSKWWVFLSNLSGIYRIFFLKSCDFLSRMTDIIFTVNWSIVSARFMLLKWLHTFQTCQGYSRACVYELWLM